jgi:hypothetical protein
LSHYPLSLDFRDSNSLALKLFDFAYFLNADRLVLLDSDVLFFAEPREFLRRIEDSEYKRNCFNEDDETAYTITSKAALQHLKIPLQPRVNSGLALVHRESLSIDWIEEFLAVPGVAGGHRWRIEQTLFALLSSRFGVDLLPGEYRVHLTKGSGLSPVRHYVGPVRHLLYSEGIRDLLRLGFLDQVRSR